MARTTRSKVEIGEVKNRIIDCAIEIIEKNGVENLTMAALGSRLRMTGPNLYNYFPGRDELLISLNRKLFQGLLAELTSAAENSGPPGDRLRALVMAFIGFGTRNAHIYDLMFSRPRRITRDYAGTPQEDLAGEETRIALGAMNLAAEVLKEHMAADASLNVADPHYLIVKVISELHGIISLHNSGLLFDMVEKPREVLMKIAGEIIDSALLSHQPKK